MIIDLFQISDSEHPFSFEISPADIEWDEETARLEKTITIAGKLKKGIAQVDVAGKITGEIELDCARCLNKASYTLDFPFKAVFVTEENYTTDAEAELRGDDLEVAVYDGASIDLSELAREQILLNLPIRFVCRDDCRGLCRRCGADLNNQDCDCPTHETDPRWAALLYLQFVKYID